MGNSQNTFATQWYAPRCDVCACTPSMGHLRYRHCCLLAALRPPRFGSIACKRQHMIRHHDAGNMMAAPQQARQPGNMLRQLPFGGTPSLHVNRPVDLQNLVQAMSSYPDSGIRTFVPRFPAPTPPPPQPPKRQNTQNNIAERRGASPRTPRSWKFVGAPGSSLLQSENRPSEYDRYCTYA